MEALTNNEEQVMRIIWKLEKALVRAVLNEFPEPRPPYTTLASIIRQLENKGYLDHKTYGNTHEYFPVISKKAYQHRSFNQLVKNYFDGSAKKVLSFMVKEEKLTEKDIQELEKIVENFKNKKS
ncbi:BlaI/MecI/CopY family transcriptional regulator [Cyclobacterium marinum]|uniref:Transcriptional repressor, CopY family n=1 Tax=Cyclobacterium marinum (strain ATCC 25205 / DSM 745 / LMG 13164 / NCIMB 1802) TaxID=880070 RepID=G0J4Q3_CYCMS|nr:BlaI/MecI/CopY family transcriptional regulator [Cyclobacterium marinum]AEL25283.1 transcriptional repressor, CopY family [Cyclobacterium marinum DSM 745]MBI0400641.1 BlaI/MecI/CopY family transcriptional regulator [Cyclobacterium marinum]MBR9778038.1 BlaI/MecI/CopY family transcriptional regulator [Cytophagales bacterium]|tara:strand:+ start:34879 stop:35250 length:372 start_codon:yes stop_codon:yes gene_type:complete